jgi:effector-binding domain-containing protein
MAKGVGKPAMTEMHVVDLEPHSGAGIEMFTPWQDMRANIRKLFDRVYAPGALTPGHGHNFIMYRDDTTEGITMTVGVLDRQPGGADPEVKPAHIPGGRVMTGTHWGDYGKMKTTYDAIEAEITARGLKALPKSLEIYGDWYDDPAKVRTDIYVYLGVLI